MVDFFQSIILPLVVMYIAGFGRQFSVPGQMKTVRYQGLGPPLLRGLVAFDRWKHMIYLTFLVHPTLPLFVEAHSTPIS